MESINEKKPRKPRTLKEQPTPIYVCRNKQTGKYKKCDKPKKIKIL
jgi:hypothetical protein